MMPSDSQTSSVGKPAADRPPVLELTGITKSFGPLVAVSDLSLTVRPNEVVGLLGENGAGKSTLLKILTGVYPPDKGTIAVNGKTVTLHMADLKPVMQMRMIVKVKAADGTPVNVEIDNTVNKVPGVPGSIATPQPAVPLSSAR